MFTDETRHLVVVNENKNQSTDRDQVCKQVAADVKQRRGQEIFDLSSGISESFT